MIAAQCQTGAYLGRYVVVVDDDIDIYDMNEVFWAMCTRVDPAKRHRLHPPRLERSARPAHSQRRKGFSSRAIIDATRPYEWVKSFPRLRRRAKD